ncbi:MAG TPA: biotin attachment protein [Candidatus Hydrogenedens sp.]|nr:biotin attachment protein [Candidatus Hydrogenedens sp.]
MEYFVRIPDEAKPDEADVKIQVSQWLYKLNDMVQKGTDLVEICTDKAVYVVSVPVSGVLSKIFIEDGQYFSPDDSICIIDTTTD